MYGARAERCKDIFSVFSHNDVGSGIQEGRNMKEKMHWLMVLGLIRSRERGSLSDGSLFLTRASK